MPFPCLLRLLIKGKLAYTNMFRRYGATHGTLIYHWTVSGCASSCCLPKGLVSGNPSGLIAQCSMKTFALSSGQIGIPTSRLQQSDTSRNITSKPGKPWKFWQKDMLLAIPTSPYPISLNYSKAYFRTSIDSMGFGFKRL